MIRPPFMARVAAGVAVTAYEETLKLPSTAVALPMTTVSQILQTTMRLQQVMTSLAIKGDQLLEALGAGPEETADWAVFDEDVPSRTHTNGATPEQGAKSSNPGRFALYSTPTLTEAEAESADTADVLSDSDVPPALAQPAPAAKKTPVTKPAAKTSVPAKSSASAKASGVPEIAEYLDYDSLTLAQLRARLRTLSVEDLTALLDYETTNAARAPFVTMLSNRITTARSK